MPDTCIRFGELGARVMIEDKEVQHYAMQVDPVKKEVSCWIASEEGKPLSYPDDDTYLDTSPSHSIGEIKLVIDRTTVPLPAKDIAYYSPLAPHLQKVHERSKKAIAHRVNYGSEIPNPQKRIFVTSKPIETLVTFIFKYRPLDMLRANDIVPQNPEPLEPQEHALNARPTSETSSGKGEHPKVKREHESESEDEDSMREKALLAEAERIRTEVEKIRKGRQLKDGERPKKKLKKEDKLLFVPGEIIDLT